MNKAGQSQFLKLKKQLEYVAEHSPFYKNHFKKQGIDPAAIETLSDFKKITPIGKKEVSQNAKDFWCVSPDKVIDYVNTSGTEGKPLTIPLTELDLQRLAYNEQSALALTGGTSKETYQLTTTTDRRFMAGLAYVLGARALGAGMVRVGPGLPELQWQTILELKVTALIVVPSFLVKLIDYAIEHRISLEKSPVKKAICIGEPIRHDDFTLNALGRRISENWDIDLYSTYASSEMATAFTECSEGQGGHVLNDLIYAEVLDDAGNEVGNGEIGELCVTTLGVEGFPLIRFRTGDMCAMHHEPCACGKNTPRLGPIVGRKHQMIKYKGTTCYPPAIFDVLDQFKQVSHYQIEIFTNELGNDDLVIRYAAPDITDETRLIDKFKTTIRFAPKLCRLTTEEMMALVYPSTSRKPIRVNDRRMSL